MRNEIKKPAPKTQKLLPAPLTRVEHVHGLHVLQLLLQDHYVRLQLRLQLRMVLSVDALQVPQLPRVDPLRLKLGLHHVHLQRAALLQQAVDLPLVLPQQPPTLLQRRSLDSVELLLLRPQNVVVLLVHAAHQLVDGLALRREALKVRGLLGLQLASQRLNERVPLRQERVARPTLRGDLRT